MIEKAKRTGRLVGAIFTVYMMVGRVLKQPGESLEFLYARLGCLSAEG